MGFAAGLIPPAPCEAGDGAPAGAAICPTCRKPYKGAHKHPGPGVGTLGYGPPGLHPGFQGFGLGYHLGYGYGGYGLGPGADGGYPFYGGPGYPHPEPRLWRCGGLNPFPFYGGPGGPTPTCPNYFGAVGPLVSDRPVIEIERRPGEADYGSGYGSFTGVIPYPEAAFAPFTTSAATGGSTSGGSSASPPNAPSNTAPDRGEVRDDHAATRTLGVDAEPFADAGGRGLKITRVYLGSPARAAGLRDGDVIRSINGYATELPSHLAWIVESAAPGRILRATMRSADDGRVRAIAIQVP